MSSKQNISLHLDGINACESRQYDHALNLFKRITEPSSVIFFNMGCCNLKLNMFTEAMKMFQECVSKDKYLAIGHFQLAIAQSLCQDLTSAANSFRSAFDALRGFPFIDYKQLNMTCKLYAAEINFDLGLVYLFSGDYGSAKDCFHTAASLPMDSTRHSRISEAIEAVETEKWAYFGKDVATRLILLPENSFFRVSKAKMEGLQTSTKFMAEAKVVAAANDEYSFVGFVGAKKLQANTNSPSSSPATPKRVNPAVGPPPSKPPPRLGSAGPPPSRPVSSPVPNREPPVVPGSPSRAPPSRTAPPSRAPPIVPRAREVSPSKPPTGRKSPAGRRSPSPSPPSKSQVTLKCEFQMDIDNDISYDDLIAKISQKLTQNSSDMSNSLQRKTMNLDLQDPLKKTNVPVNQHNTTMWQSALNENKQGEAVLLLKEAPVPNRRPPSPRTRPSPGYKPTRPAPSHNLVKRYNELTVGEDIYHDIS